jgi:UDP-N-acetyl-D-mannosaminuronic acid dehydrogenase
MEVILPFGPIKCLKPILLYITPMDKKILLVGGGFVGLTLAAKLLKKPGASLTVLESDDKKLKYLLDGNYYVNEPGLNSALNSARLQGRLEFCKYLESENFDAVFICVGTSPEIFSGSLPENFYTLTEIVKNHLTKNGFVFLRSTVTIGTTENFALIINTTGRPDISTFFLPERTAEGVALKELDVLPQIIGPTNNSNISEAINFLEEFDFNLIRCTNSRSAEFVKLISNAWRDTTFAISNEIALMSELLRVDANEIILTANYDYPRGNIPLPGPVGGPCLYKDTHILLKSFSEEFKKESLIFNARIKNEMIETLLYEIILREVRQSHKNSIILFLGAAFKGSPKTNDIRNGLTSNLIKRIFDDNLQVVIKIWYAALRSEDLINLKNFHIQSLNGLSPTVVVIGNNSPELLSQVVVDFLNELSSKTLIIDPWSMYKKFDKTAAKIYQLGNRT